MGSEQDDHQESGNVTGWLGVLFSVIAAGVLGLGRVGKHADKIPAALRSGAKNIDIDQIARRIDAGDLRNLDGNLEDFIKRAQETQHWQPVPELQKDASKFGPADSPSLDGQPINDRNVVLREIDVDGAIRDAMELAKQQQPKEKQPAEPLKCLSILRVIYSSRTEFRGPAGGELDVTKVVEDSEITLSANGRQVSTQRGISTRLPEKDLGEFERCQVRFSDDNRVFLWCFYRSVRELAEPIEHKALYELEFIQGSRADFERGKPVRLQLSREGLRRQKEDYQRISEECLRQIIAEQESHMPPAARLAGQRRVKCSCDSFPQAVIVASPTELVTQDVGITVTRISVIDGGP